VNAPLHLFDGYPSAVLARFKEWHHANPHVYSEFKRLAFEMKATGRQRYSARTIMEVLRWHYDIKTKGDVFELNDNFTPIYVRMLMYYHPEFSDFFELRTVRSRGVFSDEQRRREYLSDPQAGG
jgi:hypothetical protein